MPSSSPIKIILLMSLLSISMSIQSKADASKDREECAPQLLSLATCLPYVSNKARAPTPDCCNGLKQVLTKHKKCLCVIVRDRNDPDVGIEINVTLALGLPSVCHAPANVSQCPELLKMDPKSSEAQVFYQLSNNSSSVQNTSSASSPASSAQVTSISPVAQAPTSTGWNLQSIDFGVVLTIFFNLIYVLTS